MPAGALGRNATGLRGASNLMVRIGRGVAARSVSVPLPADAQITWTAPGGDDTLTCTIPWPDRGIARPDAFTHNMPVRVEDRRTGEIIWQGRVSDPGFSGDRHSQEFRLSAVGSGRDLDSISVLKNYVDRDLSHWVDLHTWPSGDLNTQDASSGFIANFFDSLSIAPEGMLEFPWPNGTTQKTNDFQRMVYMVGFNAAKDLLTDDLSSHSTGPTSVVPEIHGIRFSWMSNFANANQVGLLAGSGVAGSTITLYTAAFTTGVQQDVSARDTLSTWTRTDIKFLYLSQSRTGANVTSTGDAWVRFANIHVIGKRYSRYGVDQTESSGIEALKPYLIVEDLLGTVLNGKFDPGQIYTDNVLIDQASWWSATPVSDILAAANEWNGDAWWGVWAPANPDALPRLDYRYWNVSPRYTLDDTAQVTLQGGGEEWANSALVTYMRGNGVQTTTRATVTVPAIRRVFGSSGVGTLAINTRDLSLDLSDRGPMTRAKAVELAGQMLYASATDKASGSAVVTGPIIDDSTGRIVQPWEIRPGWPILVGSTPNQFTSGTPLTYDGESTFRLTKVTYSAQDDTATLELDGGARHLFKGSGAGPRFHFTSWAARARARRRR
jgi:hypothetical protein